MIRGAAKVKFSENRHKEKQWFSHASAEVSSAIAYSRIIL